MTTGGSSIYWDDGTYRQRIINTDDSTANTAVFNFQQSENSGSSWKNLLEIRDNGRLVLTNKTGGIYRVDDGATNEPLIHLSNNNVDSSIIRIDGNDRTSVVDTQAYGFDLKYIGTGAGENNSLDLIADNLNGANVTAISVSNNGKIGIGDKFNTNYRLYVNGNSYLKGNNFLYGDLSAFYDGVDQYLQYTAEGTVASHAAKISLYRIIASGKAGTAGTKVPGVQLDAATGLLHLQAAASDPSATAGARIKFTYWNSASDNDQPVYISHVVNDSYRAPYGLKIWGGDGTAPGAWLEVEGNLYIGSASNSNSNNNAALYIRGMSAIEGYDSWLRLNDNSSFTSGTYSPKLIRSDEALQVGSGGANFYANSSGNGYIQNTFGVHGTDTTKHFFVNGTSRFADDITMDNGSEILFSTNTQYLRWTANTGDNNSTGRSWYGIGTYQNTSDSNNSWLNISNYWGINITTKGNTCLRHNNNVIPHTNNQTGTVGSTSQPVYVNGGVVTAITGTLANSISGNANRAQLLRNYYVDTASSANSANRPASANLATTGSGGLVTFKATNSMTTAKPPADAHILHMFWDNAGGYDTQIAVQNDNGTIYSRGCSAGTWNPWKTILDSDNYTSYTVTKTGSGASGTWGINISGNAATATAVKDRQTGTITYLNYGASGLTSASWLAAWNGYELRAISLKTVQDLVQHSRQVTVDLSSLDNSKWFPVTGTSLPSFGYNKIKVSVQLNSGTVPSWSTHASGFTCNMELYVTAAGWGTTGGETIVLASSYSFASVDPCGFQQQSYNSMPVLWLRGGGKYFVETDFDCTWTVRTSSYDTYNSGGYVQTVTPTTTHPGIQGINGTIKAGKVYGAVWNDYAEYRSTSTINPGQCVVETGLGNLVQSTKRLQPGANIVSDTFGFAIGETEKTKTPLAVSGRVLAYPYEDRYSYSAGDPVCSGPNGTISKMTRKEVREYPDRIVGTVSEIPEYETWGTGNVKVDGRIWIKVR